MSGLLMIAVIYPIKVPMLTLFGATENTLAYAIEYPTPEIIYVTPEPTAVPVPTAVPAEQEKTDKPSQMTAIIALVGIAALAIIGVVLFKKNKNGGSKMMSDNDFDLRDEDADESEQSEE